MATLADEPGVPATDARAVPLHLSLETRAALALAAIDGLGPASYRELIDRYGSARSAIGRDPGRGTGLRLPRTVREAVAAARPVPEERVRAHLPPDVRIVSYGGDGYPPRLARLHYPPPVLYLRGPLEDVGDRAVAVVGTRRATAYGRRLSCEIAGGLAATGWTVVSGLARGIDAEAHEAALAAAGRTVGVLGCGLRHVYPASNRQLYESLARRGLLMSEFKPDAGPRKEHFPRRNRIIAALCRAVVVVQAGARSGALITADHALALGVDVLAVPGPAGLPASEGVHELLRDGAGLVASAEDVLSTLGDVAPALRAGGTTRPARATRRAETRRGFAGDSALAPPSTDGRALEELEELLGDGPATIDELTRAARMATPEALALLSRLELAGIVRSLPGSRFELARRP